MDGANLNYHDPARANAGSSVRSRNGKGEKKVKKLMDYWKKFRITCSISTHVRVYVQQWIRSHHCSDGKS
jgi:hypothetical protein